MMSDLHDMAEYDRQFAFVSSVRSKRLGIATTAVAVLGTLALFLALAPFLLSPL
jgi:hypothetical protein